MRTTPTLPPDPGKRISRAAILPALAVFLLWLVFLLEYGLQLDLHRWGILPRHASGLPGIVLSPFLHGDLEHLFNNSVPLFVLGWALLYFYPRIAGRVVLVAWLLGGLWVWISARTSYHIGASGVVYGLAAFLFTSGMLRKQRTLMALSLLVVFLYGSLLWGLFPLVDRISWESHFWGAVSGVVMAFLHRDVPPAVQDPVPSFLDEEDDDDEPPAQQDAPAVPIPPLRVVYTSSPADPTGNTMAVDPDRSSSTWSPPGGPLG